MLVLFPDSNVFPAQGLAGAKAARCARGWQGWRSLEDAEVREQEAPHALPGALRELGWKISGAGGRLRAPGPAGPGRQRLQHQGQRAGSRERRGRTERGTAEAP